MFVPGASASAEAARRRAELGAAQVPRVCTAPRAFVPRLLYCQTHLNRALCSAQHICTAPFDCLVGVYWTTCGLVYACTRRFCTACEGGFWGAQDEEEEEEDPEGDSNLVPPPPIGLRAYNTAIQTCCTGLRQRTNLLYRPTRS